MRSRSSGFPGFELDHKNLDPSAGDEPDVLRSFNDESLVQPENLKFSSLNQCVADARRDSWHKTGSISDPCCGSRMFRLRRNILLRLQERLLISKSSSFQAGS